MASIEERVRADVATELERLGSDRGLIALTDADLSKSAIQTRVAGVLWGVADRYEDWSTEVDAFEDATTKAESLAETAADERVEPAMDHDLVRALTDAEPGAARVGAGLIGAPLVIDGWTLQGVSFFVNEADGTAADRFRDVRSGLDELVALGETTVDSSDEDAAVEAAVTVIETAYDDYVETLAGMGLDPKTVC